MPGSVSLLFSESRRIVLAGTLDTKGEEIFYLKGLFEAAGANPLLLDLGVHGEGSFTPEVTRHEIAKLGGKAIQELLSIGDRGVAVTTMEAGFARWVRLNAGRIAGILSIGGSGGTTIATSGMRELPIGIPKFMVSTVASGNTRQFVQTSDISMQYSVADFSGLNRFTRLILRNAAAAMLGMVGLAEPLSSGALPGNQPDSESRPLAAATMYGVTTPCVNQVREILDRNGFELMIFHANGAGGQAMERLAHDGFLTGVLDITTAELGAELLGGHFSAGPDRLKIAGELGLPQVISVGAMDMVAFGPRSTVPQSLTSRNLYVHNSNVTLMRTNQEENTRLGQELVKKMSAAKGPVSILLPLRGLSALDAAGQPFEDVPANKALFAAVREAAAGHVRVIEVDAHINDSIFAEALATEFLRLVNPQT
ncbi:MAG: Tm-1-like ATP-binding domain-containing protein [Bryobacteraceae bacterium]